MNSLGQPIDAGSDSTVFKRLLRTNIVLPIFLVLVLCLAYIAQMLYLLRQNQEIARRNQAIAEVTRLMKEIVDAETGMRGFLLTRQESFLEPYLPAVDHAPTTIANLNVLFAHSSLQKERLDSIESLFQNWQALAEKRIEGARGGQPLDTKLSGQGRAIMDSIRSLVQAALDSEVSERDELSERSEESTRLVILFTLLGGIGVALLLAYLGRRQLLFLASSYESSLRHQKEQNTVLEHQAWLRTGQSELLASLRGELSEEEVSKRVLSFLSRYLGAELGAIYARGQRERTFHRLGALGLDSKALEARRSFAWAEGILGKAAETQSTQQLDNLPADYLKISTSLGDTPVRKLIVQPFRAHGETTAVMELGFLNERFAPAKTLEFLELIEESIGTILQSTGLRSRQKALFEETQQLNEELQAQQEELRVSNEELEQQASILKESQAKMEAQQVELEESNQKLESQKMLLQEKARELSSASQYKSEFLANMSHELRTPLNSSLILAKLLSDNSQGNLTAEQVEFADTIYSAGNDLLALINDILDLAKVEAGRLELHAENMHLTTMAENLRKIFQPLADRKRISLEFDVESKLSLESDRLRLEQILKNLLSNAIKFTEKGKVSLHVSAQNGRIHFAVADTGIGIPENQHENIFEAFRQADGTTNRRYGGTGLGLSISRELAHLLGGNISLTSRPGEGSRFEFDLPLKMPRQETSEQNQLPKQSTLANPAPFSVASSSPQPSPRRTTATPDDRNNLDANRRLVLVVEDEAPFAKALYRLAQELGFQCIVTHSAAEGLAAARQYLPHAIILDVALPDQTGMSVLDNLKDDLRTRHIPVHIISGHDYSQTAFEMGAIGYLLKPAGKEELTRAFRLLEEKFSQTLKRVLIVEDDLVQRKSIASLISGKGVEAVHAENGSEALATLQKMKFDCVILDLSLPDMTGFDLLEKMANLGEAAFPPVIVYTGRDLTREEENQLRRHSNSIIVKGARSPERLLDEVTLFLHQVESELPPEKRKMIQAVKNRDKLLEGRTILLVDDDARNLFALMHVLEPKGAKVEVARNGKEALVALKNLRNVDLVLMDIMMPEMDGYEAIREIRKNPDTAKLPVIAVTAKAMSSDYEKCLNAGANDYLAKPIDVSRLMSLIKVWIQRGSLG